MALMTGKQYIKSLEKLKTNIFAFGDKLTDPTNSAFLEPFISSVRSVYDLSCDPEYDSVMTAVSHLNGEKISRFNHIHQSTGDLIKKMKMQRFCQSRETCCSQLSLGLDAINSIYSTAFDTDEKYGTSYFDNFKQFLNHIQTDDLYVEGAVAEPKNSFISPSAQNSPDKCLHVVERRPDGIIVRGARVCQAGVCGSHELLVMPPFCLGPEDADYAVAFSVPTDTEGVIIIIGSQTGPTGESRVNRSVESRLYGETEVLVVFDDVFVPNERIFLNGETEFTEELADRFAAFHIQSCSGCKAGTGDVLTGAIALAAQYNGSDGDSYVRNNLYEMNHLNETIFSCGIACSAQGHRASSGGYVIDLSLCNVCKQNVTRFPYEITRLARGITRELMIIVPSESEFRSEKLAEYIDKYFKGADGVRTEYRLKIMRLIGELMFGSTAIDYLTEPMRGDGYNQEQKMKDFKQTDLENKKNLARLVAGID